MFQISSNLWTNAWWVPIIKSLLLVWKSTNNGVYEELFWTNRENKKFENTKIVDSMIKLMKLRLFPELILVQNAFQ